MKRSFLDLSNGDKILTTVGELEDKGGILAEAWKNILGALKRERPR